MIKKQIGLRDGIILALGSIIGSGILFLPSLTYKLSGSNIAIVWLIATLLCFPLLTIFKDFGKHITPGRGVEEFVSLGLGRHIGSSIPMLFLSTVIIGMPSSAIIAGQYVSQYLGSSFMGIVTSYGLILFGILSCLSGVKIGGKINFIITAALLIIGIAILSITTPLAISNYSKIAPTFQIKSTLAGVVVAFWAFAGFENLTFLIGEFKNPKRDFNIAMIVALITSGALYLMLSINYACLVNKNQIDTLAGLSQLSKSVGISDKLNLIITLFAIFCVSINLASWTWGISRMVQSSSTLGLLPSFLSQEVNSVPRNATLCLGFMFVVVLTLAHHFFDTFQDLLILVSTNFLSIYLLCMVSYTIYQNKKTKKIIGMIMSLGLTVALSSSGKTLLYPLAVATFSITLSKLRAFYGYRNHAKIS